MALPKTAREIEVRKKKYRWMLGKATFDESSGNVYSDILVQTPDNKLWKRKVTIAIDETDYSEGKAKAITPADVRSFILDKLITR